MNEQMIERSEEVARILKLLGHPKRLLLLCSISDGEKSVSELEKVCNASQSQVSQFLKMMEALGLIVGRREGNFIFYRIKDERVKSLIQSLYKLFC